jgi:uncharacterized repeat protein (TIGR03803 family)
MADSRAWKGVLVVAVTLLFLGNSARVAAPARALGESTVYEFQGNGMDGQWPVAGLISDPVGNLYGTTLFGGDCVSPCLGYGSVYELSPKMGGGWSEKLIYSLQGTPDGDAPFGNLVMDSSGDIFGTTLEGGPENDGTVFELSPANGGGWNETVLNSSKMDGPVSLIIDSSGNLYGCDDGANEGYFGDIFELSPQSGAGWIQKILYSFEGKSTKVGSMPSGNLVLDSAGNLYGATIAGGPRGDGVAFELSPQATGMWNKTVLHNFLGMPIDGKYPQGGLIAGGVNVFYGTTSNGGTAGWGVVFELQRNQQGVWNESILYNFQSGADGKRPYSQLVIDSAGNLYGTTASGGTGPCQEASFGRGCGTVFELVPSSNSWTEKILQDFQPKDGGRLLAPLLFGPSGSLFGAAEFNGTGDCLTGDTPGCGTVFEITQ